MNINIVNSTIGKKITARRKKAKLRQEDLAKLVGLSRVSLVNIEKGRQTPAYHKFMLLCAVLRCTPNDLLPPVPKVKVKYTITILK